MSARLVWPALSLAAALAVVTMPGWSDPYFTGIAISTLFFIGLSSAWNVVGGVAGQFSLGNSLFVALGGTLVGALVSMHGWNVWVALPVGAACSALLAVGIGVLMFRRELPHLSFVLVTLAFAEVGLLLVTSIDALGAASGVVWSDSGFGIAGEASYLRVALLLAVVTVAISWLVYRSRLGHHMRAIRDDEPAAAAIGINLFLTKTIALVISAVLTSVIATFYASYVVFVDPQSFASPVFSISIILYAVIGGLGTVKGPVLGTALLYPLGEILRGELGELPGISDVILGVVIVLVVLYAPTGLSGLLDRAGGIIPGRRARPSPISTSQTALTSNNGPAHPASDPHLNVTEKS